jgi:hypothetical protein
MLDDDILHTIQINMKYPDFLMSKRSKNLYLKDRKTLSKKRVYFNKIIERDDVETFKYLYDYLPNIAIEDIFDLVCAYEKTKIVEFLLTDKRFDFELRDTLVEAVENNHIRTLKLLLKQKRVNPLCYNYYPLKCAAYLGYAKIMALLIVHSHVELFANNGKILEMIITECCHGRLKILNQPIFYNNQPDCYAFQ